MMDPEATIELAAARVAPLFTLQGWRWTGNASPPGADEIADAFVDLIAELKHPGDVISTGRLVVRRSDRYEEGDGKNVSLMLMLGDYDIAGDA